jgi:hypothetical protein
VRDSRPAGGTAQRPVRIAVPAAPRQDLACQVTSTSFRSCGAAVSLPIKGPVIASSFAGRHRPTPGAWRRGQNAMNVSASARAVPDRAMLHGPHGRLDCLCDKGMGHAFRLAVAGSCRRSDGRSKRGDPSLGSGPASPETVARGIIRWFGRTRPTHERGLWRMTSLFATGPLIPPRPSRRGRLERSRPAHGGRRPLPDHRQEP